MLVPKVLLYYPQMWEYHPFKGFVLPANNKTTLDKTKKNILVKEAKFYDLPPS